MKKFKCNNCVCGCVVIMERGEKCPLICKYNNANWHEVKDETVTDCNQLPDWCKVGEWVCYYGDGKYEYFQITKIELNRLYGKDGYFSLMCNVKPARKRPFNADEMKALVGKVFTTIDGDVSIATDFDNTIKELCIYGEFFKNKELADSAWRIDGKPCYKLEHLENGEWVE